MLLFSKIKVLYFLPFYINDDSINMSQMKLIILNVNHNRQKLKFLNIIKWIFTVITDTNEIMNNRKYN